MTEHDPLYHVPAMRPESIYIDDDRRRTSCALMLVIKVWLCNAKGSHLWLYSTASNACSAEGIALPSSLQGLTGIVLQEE